MERRGLVVMQSFIPMRGQEAPSLFRSTQLQSVIHPHEGSGGGQHLTWRRGQSESFIPMRGQETGETQYCAWVQNGHSSP